MSNKEQAAGIKTLFLDIGGVLLSNGWGHTSRKLAADKFGLETSEMERRHQMAFDDYEIDKMSFDEYLDQVVFYEARNFSRTEFKAFMFQQSQALPGHIAFFKALKVEYGLKVIAVSNEARELNEYRIQQFDLDTLFDAYISSCYVHLHKPSEPMLQMACDVSLTPKEEALYIDDQLDLVNTARSFGIAAHQFINLDNTRAFLAEGILNNTLKQQT